MLRAPGVFKAGAAVAPVTSFADYDALYTELFMDRPVENREGYAEADLTRFAGNLEGELLLVHGLQDNNVLVQNSFKLAAALQEAGRPFRMMIYPKGAHGIGDAKARCHLFEMITRFFEETLGGD